ncbi:MAG: TetR/AcrR family transcriptional regulator [Clostridia bacterium]|nr:TetR/AcrR family transcriptional regulator [Clostridia bacterium]
MQYKKDELKNTILQNAENEFFEKGFQNASLRQIAKLSNTTIGNLYHYFESKEALFEALVGQEYQGFLFFINNHGNIEAPNQAWETRDIGIWRRLLREFIQKVSPVFTKRFYLLVSRSQGTRYETVRTAFISFMEEHFLEHLRETKTHCAEEMGKIISEQLLASLLTIIRDYSDETKKSELIAETLLFTLIGAMGILED